MVVALRKIKYIALFLCIVGAGIYLVFKVTWLAAILYLVLSVIFFVFRMTERKSRKGVVELMKDLFLRW